MRLKIIEVNFEDDKDWIFKLSDGYEDYFIMKNNFYYFNKNSSPISKYELDILDVGCSILCDTEKICDRNVVVRIK